MPFGRLHEEAASSGKVLALSDGAFRLWAMGLIYCQRNLTDGFIPRHAIETFGVQEKNKQRLAIELCEPQVIGTAPLWSEAPNGFQIHDYLQWNDSKADVVRMRAAGRERLTRFRKRQDGNAVENACSPPLRNAFHNTFQNAHDSGSGSEVLSSGGESEGNPTAEVRAGRLLHDLYPEWYTKFRHGARLRLISNSLAYQEAVSLCETWADDRIEKLAQIVLTTDDDFIAKTDRGFRIFALKATWADERLATWEKEHGVKA